MTFDRQLHRPFYRCLFWWINFACQLSTKVERLSIMKIHVFLSLTAWGKIPLFFVVTDVFWTFLAFVFQSSTLVNSMIEYKLLFSKTKKTNLKIFQSFAPKSWQPLNSTSRTILWMYSILSRVQWTILMFYKPMLRCRLFSKSKRQTKLGRIVSFLSLLCLVESSLRSNQQIAINAKKIRQAPAFAAIDLSFLNDKHN